MTSERQNLTVEPDTLKIGAVELSSRYGDAREMVCMLRLMDALDPRTRAIIDRVHCDTPHDEVTVYVRPAPHGYLNDAYAHRMGNRIAALIWAFGGPGNVWLNEVGSDRQWSFVNAEGLE